MQPHNLETTFDGIYHRTIPLILFSFYDDSKDFSDLLGSLYDAFYRNDDVSFNEIYNKLDKKITERRDFGSHKELLIKIFSDRFLSLDQRIKNIDKNLIDFKEGLKQIDKLRSRITEHGRSLNNIHKKINALLQQKYQDDKVEVKVIKKDSKLNINVCPICNTKLYKRTVKGKISFYCKEDNKYKHWFKKDDNGNFYYCKKCGSVMLGSGKFLRCSKCNYKEKVIK